MTKKRTKLIQDAKNKLMLIGNYKDAEKKLEFCDELERKWKKNMRIFTICAIIYGVLYLLFCFLEMGEII